MASVARIDLAAEIAAMNSGRSTVPELSVSIASKRPRISLPRSMCTAVSPARNSANASWPS